MASTFEESSQPRVARSQNGSRCLLYFSPPTGLVAEMDFSKYEFLYKDDAEGKSFTVLSREIVGVIILDPSRFDHTQFNKLFMRPIGVDAVAKPAHLPSAHDTYPIRCEFHIFLRWCLGLSADRMVNANVIRQALHLLDPRPNINFEAPILPIEKDSIRLCMGTYTDAYQIMKSPSFPHILHLWVTFAELSPIIPGYHKVDFTPFVGDRAAYLTFPPCVPLPPDTLICCWNVRGLSRPSLIDHFKQMYDRHRPRIVVLLETRIGEENMELVVTDLLGKYSTLYTPPTGLWGGVLVIWLSDFLEAEIKSTHYSGVKCDMYFKGHPRARRGLF